MRFVPSSCLKPGMIIGKDLYGRNNELMLAAGRKLSKTEISRIRHLKIQGIYITDKLSEDIEVIDVIDSSLKNSAVRAIKNVFYTTKNGDFSKENFVDLKLVVDEIIDKLISSSEVIFNIMDLKVFDDYTYYHSVNVFIFSIIIGYSMKLSKDDLYNLGMGAILHDIGKVFVPRKILDKKGELTDEEFEIMKSHSEMGWNYLRNKWNISNDSIIAVLTHHEKCNGSGYPYSLKSEKIPEFGKIVAISDVYDALTSDRPYRKAIQPSEAMEYVIGGAGLYFDPDIVSIFFKRIMPYPVGTTVKLSNGLKGIVAENNPNNGLRPRIKIISKQERDCYYIDLYDRSMLNVTIVESLAI